MAQRIRELFDRAMSMDEKARLQWLDAACGENRSLHDALAELIDAAEMNNEIISATIDKASRDLLDPSSQASAESGRYRALIRCVKQLRRFEQESDRRASRDSD